MSELAHWDQSLILSPNAKLELIRGAAHAGDLGSFAPHALLWARVAFCPDLEPEAHPYLADLATPAMMSIMAQALSRHWEPVGPAEFPWSAWILPSLNELRKIRVDWALECWREVWTSALQEFEYQTHLALDLLQDPVPGRIAPNTRRSLCLEEVRDARAFERESPRSSLEDHWRELLKRRSYVRALLCEGFRGEPPDGFKEAWRGDRPDRQLSLHFAERALTQALGQDVLRPARSGAPGEHPLP